MLNRLAESPWWFHYLRKIPELNYQATRKRLRRVVASLGSSRDEPSRPGVLDVGCGTGEFCDLFDPGTYVGVDIYQSYVDFARRRRPKYRFECADMATWSGGGRTFEMVLINGVLHHLDEEKALAVLHNAVAHAATSGTVVVIEDVDLPAAGWGTRLVHRLDYGGYIRGVDAWDTLLSRGMTIRATDVYRSGLCMYYFVIGRRVTREPVP
jgi:SAM-dependent methyltransferase